MSKQKGKYIAFFSVGSIDNVRYHRHDVKKLFTKKTAKPFMMFSSSFKLMPEHFEPKPHRKIAYDEVLKDMKPGDKLITLKMRPDRKCGEKQYWLIVSGDKLFVFLDVRYEKNTLCLASDLDEYYIKKQYKNELVEKAGWETYNIYELINRTDIYLDYRYDKHQLEMRKVMKNQFLEELVQYVCHPSRVNTFESLGFYE